VRLTHWRGPLRRAVFVALVTALPLPLAAAGDSTASAASAATSKTPKTMQAAVHAAAMKDAALVASPRAKVAKRADQSSADKQSPSFFRSGAGVVVLGVLAVGAGYAIYSASHDKINSPAKK